MSIKHSSIYLPNQMIKKINKLHLPMGFCVIYNVLQKKL